MADEQKRARRQRWLTNRDRRGLPPRSRPRRWWVSWYERSSRGESMSEARATRPITPTLKGVLAWWVSGWAMDGEPIMCALVDARDEATAKGLVSRSWDVIDWRFCEQKSGGWKPAADRFPWPKTGKTGREVWR